VLVPPISNPITGQLVSPFCEIVAVLLYPTTPPAGPLKIAFDPVNWSILANPPSLYIKNTLTFAIFESKPATKPAKYL